MNINLNTLLQIIEYLLENYYSIFNISLKILNKEKEKYKEKLCKGI